MVYCTINGAAMHAGTCTCTCMHVHTRISRPLEDCTYTFEIIMCVAFMSIAIYNAYAQCGVTHSGNQLSQWSMYMYIYLFFKTACYVHIYTCN